MDRKKEIALSFSVPVAWGFSYPLMKIGMDGMNATSIVALRCAIAFIVCVLLFHKCTFRINRDLIVRAAIIGAIMAVELTCMCLGSSLTSASTAGFLQSLTVVIVPFANALLLRRAPERKVLVALALICSAYGFITQAYVQPHVPAETTGFAFSLEPVCSAVFSFFLVGEVLTPIAFLGAALIMAGVFVATIEPPRLHAPAYPQEAMAVEPKRVS